MDNLVPTKCWISGHSEVHIFWKYWRRLIGYRAFARAPHFLAVPPNPAKAQISCKMQSYVPQVFARKLGNTTKTHQKDRRKHQRKCLETHTTNPQKKDEDTSKTLRKTPMKTPQRHQKKKRLKCRKCLENTSTTHQNTSKTPTKHTNNHTYDQQKDLEKHQRKRLKQKRKHDKPTKDTSNKPTKRKHQRERIENTKQRNVQSTKQANENSQWGSRV